MLNRRLELTRKTYPRTINDGNAGMATKNRETATARVEIDSATLTRLIRERRMGAAELKCLDGESKRLLWKICLDTCLD